MQKRPNGFISLQVGNFHTTYSWHRMKWAPHRIDAGLYISKSPILSLPLTLSLTLTHSLSLAHSHSLTRSLSLASTFWSFWNTFLSHGDPKKLDPSAGWIRAPWTGFKPTHAPSSAALFQCRNVKKRRAQICDQIQRFIKIPTGLHRKTRTPNASAERIVADLITLKHCRVKKTVSPSTPTCWRRTPSFRSRRNTISHRETQTDKGRKQRGQRKVFPLSVCLMSS